MRIVTAVQMKQIERNADASGLSYLQMMENAGTSAYQAIRSHRSDAHALAIVAGKGNNGGDGFVIARLAAQDGLAVRVVLAEGEPVTADAQTNFRRLDGLDVTVCTIEQTDELTGADVVVDALYGTGFHGALRPSGAKACRLMNESGAYIAALDLPSGIHADTGAVAEGAVRAHLTVTFDSYKPLHVQEVSKPYCGEIVLADIGISEDFHNGIG